MRWNTSTIFHSRHKIFIATMKITEFFWQLWDSAKVLKFTVEWCDLCFWPWENKHVQNGLPAANDHHTAQNTGKGHFQQSRGPLTRRKRKQTVLRQEAISTNYMVGRTAVSQSGWISRKGKQAKMAGNSVVELQRVLAIGTRFSECQIHKYFCIRRVAFPERMRFQGNI